MKILIVDDNEDNRVLQETVLKAKGYAVECAANGVEALEIAIRSLPDIIVSDVLMPEMDGFELCRAVRADERLRKIPFVFYSSSYTGSKDKELATALSASRYIVKPMEMEEFVKIIEETHKEHEDGKLTIPERPKLDDKELERMHEKVLVNKLSEKVEELEKEITRRKQIEDALRESEEQFRSTFEQAAVGIAHVAPNGQFLRTNKRFCDILGYPEDGMFKLTFQDITHSDELEMDPNLANQLLDGKIKSYTMEKRYLKKDGTIIWVNLTISLVHKPDGEPKYFISVIEDITKRKQAEQSLLDSEEKFRTISATANDAIIMADNDGNISYWNKAAEKMFGYSNEEAIGKKIHETCITNMFHENLLRGLNKFKDTGQEHLIGRTTESTAINRDGTEFPIEFSLSEVKIKGKWNTVAIIRNITERLRIEENLRVSYKMASLGRLTAGVFHEILNPVNIISSHIQLLLMEAEKGSKTEEDLNSVQEEIARIVKITDSLLRFSRKGEPGSEKIEINDLLEKMISLIEPDMKLDNIRFVKKFDDRLVQISGNRDELRQVFLNLTTNARDAMPDGGTITVKTLNVLSSELGVRSAEKEGSELKTQYSEHKGDFVEISFEDTGCGIDKDKMEFIFEPFFTTKKEGKGTGLGLSTSYGIIENHGGILSVESKVGKGTTFTIDLQVKD